MGSHGTLVFELFIADGKRPDRDGLHFFIKLNGRWVRNKMVRLVELFERKA